MQKGAGGAGEQGGSTERSRVQLLEADGAVGQGTVLQRLPSSSDRPPQTIAIMMALRTPLRSAGILLGGDAPGISSSLVYDLWELWVWRSISSSTCTPGCV